MNNREYQILRKLINEVGLAAELISDMDYDAFCKDEKTKRACCMMLINIG